MMKSKASVTRKKKSIKAATDMKKKQIKSSTHSKGKIKQKEKKKILRKSRWEEAKTSIIDGEAKKIEQPPDPIAPGKNESLDNFLRIKDFLNEKEKIVESLFLTMTGPALDEIIPDYLKNRSTDELKKLCFKELEKMSNDEILEIVSAEKQPVISKEIAIQTETVEELRQTDESDGDLSKNIDKNYKSLENSISTHVNDILDLCVSANEINNVFEDENQAPAEVVEKVATDLGISGEDAELLELEMRARAIRSLLKTKPNES